MNILVCNFQNTGDNVLVFVDEEAGLSLSASTLEAALTAAGKQFDDVFEIGDDEIQYYIFQPLWADEKMVNNARKLAGESPCIVHAEQSYSHPVVF